MQLKCMCSDSQAPCLFFFFFLKSDSRKRTRKVDGLELYFFF